MTVLARRIAAVSAAALLAGCAATGPEPQPGEDELRLVQVAEQVLYDFLSNPNYEMLRRFLPEANGVVILPDVVKAGFFFSAEGGNGVIVVRRGPTWSDPSFVTLASGGFGLQAGGEVRDVVMLIKSPRAVEALVDNTLTLGAEASFALGRLGQGVGADATTNFNSDILAFTDATGAFAGVALEGASVAPREGRNADFYGGAMPADVVLFSRRPGDPRGDGLRFILGGATFGGPIPGVARSNRTGTRRYDPQADWRRPAREPLYAPEPSSRPPSGAQPPTAQSSAPADLTVPPSRAP